MRTNDEVLHQDLRKVFLEEAPEDTPPTALYTAYVERRMTATRRHLVFRGDTALCITAFYPSIIPTLEGDVLRSLQRLERDCSFADSAAVAAGGEALLLLGENYSARGRLLYRIIRMGGCYLSDRMTILRHADGRVVPISKAIAGERMKHPLVTRMRKGMTYRGTERMIVRYLTPPKRCRSRPDQTWPVGSVFFLEPERSALARVAPVTRADAWARLMEASAGPLAQGPEVAQEAQEPEGPERLDTMGRVAGSSRAFRVWPAGAKETAAAILRAARGD